jgi:hypothetical protein
METLTYTPDRTDFEPVGKIHVAKIILHEKIIEIRVSYEYTDKVKNFETGLIEEKPNMVQAHDIVHKHNVSLSRTTLNFEYDERENRSLAHVIQIIYQSEKFWIWASKKECDDLFPKLRKWLLN